MEERGKGVMGEGGRGIKGEKSKLNTGAPVVLANIQCIYLRGWSSDSSLCQQLYG